jgi:hypothetical protein
MNSKNFGTLRELATYLAGMLHCVRFVHIHADGSIHRDSVFGKNVVDCGEVLVGVKFGDSIEVIAELLSRYPIPLGRALKRKRKTG